MLIGSLNSIQNGKYFINNPPTSNVYKNQTFCANTNKTNWRTDSRRNLKNRSISNITLNSVNTARDLAQNIYTLNGEINAIMSTLPNEAEKAKVYSKPIILDALKKLKNVEADRHGVKSYVEVSPTVGFKKSFELTDDGHLIINDYKNKTRIEALGGNLRKFSSGVEVLKNGTEKIGKRFSFYDNGELFSYGEGFEKHLDGTSKLSKGITLKNVETVGLIPCSYQKNRKTFAGGYETEKSLDFKNGKMKEYKENHLYSNGITKIDKKVEFEDNKPVCCLMGVEKSDRDDEKILAKITFSKDKAFSLSSYAKEDLTVEFKDNSPFRYTQEYIEMRGSTRTKIIKTYIYQKREWLEAACKKTTL